MRATLSLALAALLLAAPTAHAQFADQRTFATTSTGSANAQAVAIPNFALNVGVVVRAKMAFTNTGAMTLNVNGTGAKSVMQLSGGGLIATVGGEVAAGQIAEFIYDGTQYELMRGATNLIQHAATNAALQAIVPTAAGQVYVRDGFYAAGDGGQATYTGSLSNCTTADNGAQVQPSGNGCWLVSLPSYGLDPRIFGIFCGGTDETTLWNKVFTAYPGGLHVDLPPGNCTYSTLTWPANYFVEGFNKTQSNLVTNSATGDANIFGAADVFQHLTFGSIVTRTGGNFVDMNGNGDEISDFNCAGYFVCVAVGVNGIVGHPVIKDGLMFSPTLGAASGGILEQNFSNAIVDTITMSGASYPGQQPDFGLKFVNGDTAFVSNTNITLHGQALLLSPPVNNSTYAIQFANDVFDSAGTITGGVTAPSCTVGGAGNVYETTMANVWCGLSKSQDGMIINTSGSGVVDGLHITNPMFEGNAGSGVRIATANLTNWDVKGGSASGNAAAAVYISAATTHGSITSGFKGNPNGPRGANNYGLNINAAVDYLTILGNDFTGNTSGNFINTAILGGHNRISENVGYNPVGVTGPNTVGASPATICAQFTDENHYYTQSATNTATVKLGSSSGQLVGTMSSPTTVVATHLGPGECEVVIWTTTAPTYSASLH